jgi:hypothetical protein
MIQESWRGAETERLAYIAIFVLVITLAAGVFMAFLPCLKAPTGKPALTCNVSCCFSVSYDGLTTGYGSMSRIKFATSPPTSIYPSFKIYLLRRY